MTTLIFLYVLPLVFVFLFVSWASLNYNKRKTRYELETKEKLHAPSYRQVLLSILFMGFIPGINMCLSYLIISDLLKETN